MMKLITEELLDTVTSQAKENSRLRMNYNFHASMDAPIHRLLNALEPGTYLPPHRHTDKEETYLVLRGSLLAFFYDDAGNVTDKVCLNPSEGKYGLEIPSNTWHSIIALESGTVIFEIKKGPYRLCKLNCVMLYSHSISSVGERPAPRGGTTRPDECKITTI